MLPLVASNVGLKWGDLPQHSLCDASPGRAFSKRLERRGNVRAFDFHYLFRTIHLSNIRSRRISSTHLRSSFPSTKKQRKGYSRATIRVLLDASTHKSYVILYPSTYFQGLTCHRVHGRVAEPHPRLGRNDRTQREGNSPSSHPEYPSLDNTRRRPNRHYFYNCLVTFPKRSSQVGYSLNFISRHSPPNIHLWAIYCPMLLPGESSSRLFTCKSTNHRPGTGMASCEAPCHCTGD